MDNEAAEYMHEERQSTRGMANKNNCPNMEEEGRCARPREIQRHHTSKSHHETAREDAGLEDSKWSRARIR